MLDLEVVMGVDEALNQRELSRRRPPTTGLSRLARSCRREAAGTLRHDAATPAGPNFSPLIPVSLVRIPPFAAAREPPPGPSDRVLTTAPNAGLGPVQGPILA